jgi:uncharacterized membrane protein YdjX (TVP38/TMEM64 family)
MLNKILQVMKKFWRKLYDKRAYLVLILVLSVFALIGYVYFNKYFYFFKNPQKIKKWVLSFGKYGFLAFILLQIMQVVVFFIPGEIVQIAGGFIYGTFGGALISLIGITIGSLLSYVIASYFGRKFIRTIVSEKHLKFFEKILKLGSVNYVVFLVYLIPGIPKDVVAYICGISDIKWTNFLIFSTLGRIPGICISAYFGATIHTGNRMHLIVISVVMIALFAIGVFKGEKIMNKLVKKQHPQ